VEFPGHFVYQENDAMNNSDIRSLALIGARARLAELEAAVRETKDMIRLLQQAGPEKPKSKDGRRKKTVRRKHDPEFKTKVVAEARTGGITGTARKYHLSRSLVDKWIAKGKGR
jgi:DNA invertase Pin-like site-specific DNA recombinase